MKLLNKITANLRDPGLEAFNAWLHLTVLHRLFLPFFHPLNSWTIFIPVHLVYLQMNVSTSLLLKVFKSAGLSTRKPIFQRRKKRTQKSTELRIWNMKHMFKLTQNQHWALIGIYHTDVLGKCLWFSKPKGCNSVKVGTKKSVLRWQWGFWDFHSLQSTLCSLYSFIFKINVGRFQQSMGMSSVQDKVCRWTCERLI